jgi:hypothetical protein
VTKKRRNEKGRAKMLGRRQLAVAAKMAVGVMRLKKTLL